MTEYLTANFRRKEFVCPDCGLMDIEPRLVIALQLLRDKAGMPIWVTSGCRCERYNELVGGAPNSKHLTGEAADIVIQGARPHEMAKMAEMIPAFCRGGIGIYKTHIHVDVRRDGPARWKGEGV